MILYPWKIFRSSELKASAVKCRSILSIDTLDLPLNRYLIDIPDWLTLNQQSVVSWPCVSRLIWSNQKLVKSRPTVNWDVDGVSTKVSMECRLRIIVWGSKLRVSINTWPQMPLYTGSKKYREIEEITQLNLLPWVQHPDCWTTVPILPILPAIQLDCFLSSLYICSFCW